MNESQNKIKELLADINESEQFEYFYNLFTNKDLLKDFGEDDIEIIRKAGYSISDIAKEVQDEKFIEKFDFAGKYIKVYGCDGPEYINCESCSISKVSGSKQLWFKGVGFSSEFGPYDDSNYVHFSTWDDYYLDLESFLSREKNRIEGKVKKGDWNYNSYRVEIISKEEYVKAFDDMILKSIETFKEWNKE